MPGLYTPPDYDLAGFIVGCAGEDDILGPERVREGDVLLGLESSGLHTNGYSLARPIVRDRMGLKWSDQFPNENATAGEVLLRTHRSYLAALSPVLSRVHAMAHITGGGIPGNLNRALPPHLDAIVSSDAWTPPTLFTQLQRAGSVARDEMFRTFNMGIGMIVITAPETADAVADSARAAGIPIHSLGHVAGGTGRVVIH
jgi:phosphoribosylformylglycinamidine cyclo-ligase